MARILPLVATSLSLSSLCHQRHWRDTPQYRVVTSRTFRDRSAMRQADREARRRTDVECVFRSRGRLAALLARMTRVAIQATLDDVVLRRRRQRVSFLREVALARDD